MLAATAAAAPAGALSLSTSLKDAAEKQNLTSIGSLPGSNVLRHGIQGLWLDSTSSSVAISCSALTQTV